MILSKILFISLLSFSACTFAQETHSKNITKPTFGSYYNTEAYFLPDDKMLTMQVTNPFIGMHCDQIYLPDLNKDKYDTSDLKLVSTEEKQTTCSFFMPYGKHILYDSTHEGNKDYPPKSYISGKYLWAVYSDIYMANLTRNIIKQLINNPGYDPETVVSLDRKYVIFAPIRRSDSELLRMDVDRKNFEPITSDLRYDGGVLFSHDPQKMIFHSSRPKTTEKIKEYKDLLTQNLVAFTDMKIHAININGSNLRQINHLGKTSWLPHFHLLDKKNLFHHPARGYNSQIYSVDTDATNLKHVTYESKFNASPMFSCDKKRVFSSTCKASKPNENNMFIADWLDFNTTENVDQKHLQKIISYLASDELKGRLTGSEGETKAAKFIAKDLKHFGLKTEIQPFEYHYKLNPHDENSSVLIKGKNVVGYLDNKANQTIIIGAHYDHLGLNEHHNSTLINSEGQIHNGADDNASGTATVMELARIFSQNATKENANYVFVLFSGEEDGLMGSKAFAKVVKTKYPNVKAMMNMDMVGRMNQNKALTIGGVGTSPSFGKMIEKWKPAGVNIAIDSSGIGPSDHTSFYLKDIPVLFFFTGTHSDYHKPTDDEYKINYNGLKLITEYVFNLANAIANDQNLTFTKTKLQQAKAVPKYKVTLGIMPNYTDSKDGMTIDGVQEGRPAANVGIVAGDKLTKIGKCEVKEIYTYMECLSKVNAGETHPVTVIRDGKEITLNVTF